MAGLEVRGADVRFDDRPVLDGLSLSVAPGEIVAVLGPSGCGKSTLLRSIVGLQALSSGEVWLNGEHLTATPTERRGIGFLFQNPVLYPTRDVAGNLRLGLPRHVPSHGRPERIAEALKEVCLLYTSPSPRDRG